MIIVSGTNHDNNNHSFNYKYDNDVNENNYLILSSLLSL